MLEFISYHIPHDPKQGLYVYPKIPRRLLDRAIEDMAKSSIKREDVLALFDSTWSRSGDDGAIFTNKGLHIQNSDQDSPEFLSYKTITSVEVEKRLIGKEIVFLVNCGSEKYQSSLLFDSRPTAAESVAEFLQCLMVLLPSELDLIAEVDPTQGGKGVVQNIVGAEKEIRDSLKRPINKESEEVLVRTLKHLHTHRHLTTGQLDALLEEIKSWK